MSTCTIDSAYMKPGMKLARAAVSSKGQVVAPSGAILNVQMVNAIMDADIRTLCIHEDPALKLPPEARMDDMLTESSAAAGLTIATPDDWIGIVRELFVGCIREKKLDMDVVKSLGTHCIERLKTEQPFNTLLRNDPAAAYTHHHAFNSSVLSIAAAQAMGLSENDVWDVFVCALLHDIGMPQVPEHMWLTAKPLTKLFRDEIEKHPTLGFRTIERVQGANPLWAFCAQDHHERLDGSGYPNKKTAAAIPLPVRIVSACDAYAAMVMPRIWRGPILPDKAMKELIAHTEKFDRAVIGRLVQRVGIFPVASRVKLSDGSLGVVSEHRPANPLHPVVQAVRGNRVEKIDLAQTPNITVVEVISDVKPA